MYEKTLSATCLWYARFDQILNRGLRSGSRKGWEMSRAPRPLRVAALAQGLQALVLLALGLATLLSGLAGSGDPVNAALVAGLAAAGLALLAVSRGLLAAQGWARAPALVWQLIMIPVGFTTVDDVPGLAYPLLASVALVLSGLFAPSTGPALED